MASRDCSKEILGKIGKTYRIDVSDDQITGPWQVVFDELTDKQMRSGFKKMVREHGTGWPPTPGQFNGFAGGGSVNTNPKGLSATCFRLSFDEKDRLFASIDTNSMLPPQRGIPALKVKGRMDLIMSGAKSPLTENERRKLLASNSPNNPEIIELRNKQRAAFGWPLLDIQGRANNG